MSDGISSTGETIVTSEETNTNKDNNKIARGNVTYMQDHKDTVDALRYDTYEDLYAELIDGMGKTPMEAVQICRHLQAQEENYLKNIENDKVQMRVHFTIPYLERTFNWNSLSNSDKTELLWNLGMDVKNGKSWHIREERARDEEEVGGKATPLKQIVYGGERLDSSWLSLRDNQGRRVASDEAVDWRRNRNGGILREGQ